MKQLLIPVQAFQHMEHQYQIGSTLTLSSIHSEDSVPLQQLRGDMLALKLAAKIIPGLPAADVVIRRNRQIAHPEQYRLTIAQEGIEIVAATAAGAYYGIQTLREILRIHGRTLPCCRIEDQPLIARRGVYLDCSRGKVPTVATLKQLIERLAHWKINELQLYVENVFTFHSHPAIGKGFSPFTPEDMLALQAHCKQHHLRFVPSLTSFGHFEKILMLPAYRDLGEMPGFRNLPGGMTLNPRNPASIRLLADLYGEFLPLFEAEDFNACGDEPWELGRGRSKARAQRIGVGRVYWEFMMKVRQLCLKHGKRMNIWGDIVLAHPEIIPDIPRDVVMLNWSYGGPGEKRIPRTHEIADAGLPLVCCPGTSGWLSHGSRLKQANENVSYFTRVAVANGAEGLLNTDWGDRGHRNTLGVSLCSFAHGAAHAWNSPAVDDATHIERFTFHAFGDRPGNLASALRCLGAPESGYWAYSALMQSLLAPTLFTSGMANIEGAQSREMPLTKPQLEQHRDELAALKWPKPSRTLPAFETLALREFALATDMELLTYKRVLMAGKLQNGQSVAGQVLRKHAEQINAVAQNFSSLWMQRNRPSRLRDNLAGFNGIEKEALALAK